jgi:hypothetical protein
MFCCVLETERSRGADSVTCFTGIDTVVAIAWQPVTACMLHPSHRPPRFTFLQYYPVDMPHDVSRMRIWETAVPASCVDPLVLPAFAPTFRAHNSWQTSIHEVDSGMEA